MKLVTLASGRKLLVNPQSDEDYHKWKYVETYRGWKFYVDRLGEHRAKPTMKHVHIPYIDTANLEDLKWIIGAYMDGVMNMAPL
jgi:hypothetical protein